MARKKILILIFLFINFFVNCYSQNEPYSKLENDIAKNIRCLICQGQSIYDSNSEFALSMRVYIKDQIDKGISERQIYNLLVKKYGQWIVYDPGYSKKTFLLWFIPILFFLLGGAIISLRIYKSKKI
jgi:cytochrome c-type biogenesis protein CcmH